MTDEEFDLAEFIASNDALIQSLILVKYHVPYDVAMSLDAATRFGYVCIFKTMFEGRYFDFKQRRWREIEPPKKVGKGA